MSRNSDGAKRYKAPKNEQWRLKDHLCVVYVIAADENGPCKIGVSSNVQRRLNTLQVGCWLPLKVYGVRAAFRRDTSMESLMKSMESGARRVERLTHKALIDLDLQLTGEWFDVDASEALEAIQVAAKKNGCAAVSLADVAAVEFDTGLHQTNINQQSRLVKQLAQVMSFANGVDAVYDR